MPLSIPCPECTNEIPQPAERCPHCGRPGIYWNVLAAEEASEVTALELRYTAARDEASTRGAERQLQFFEASIANSKAVIARSVSEVLRLATSSRQLYAGYYELIEGGTRLPDGDEWDVLRELADSVLFPKYKQDMKFGALSLDGIGLSNYGSCSVVLRNEMIAHRTSLLDENSALFVEHHGVKISRKPNLPQGYRSSWSDRAKLCIAKLYRSIDSATIPDEYSGILLRQGTTSEGDEFVEVHIWGPITVLTMERVIVTAVDPSEYSTIVAALEVKLKKHGVATN